MARRDEGAYWKKSVTEEQRSQPPRPAARPSELFLKQALAVVSVPEASLHYLISGSISILLMRMIPPAGNWWLISHFELLILAILLA
jgi:hypothetical protein